MVDPRWGQPGYGRGVGRWVGPVADGPLQQRGLRDLDKGRQPARAHQSRSGSARRLRMAPAWPLLSRSYWYPPLTGPARLLQIDEYCHGRLATRYRLAARALWPGPPADEGGQRDAGWHPRPGRRDVVDDDTPGSHDHEWWENFGATGISARHGPAPRPFSGDS